MMLRSAITQLRRIDAVKLVGLALAIEVVARLLARNTGFLAAAAFLDKLEWCLLFALLALGVMRMRKVI